MPMGHTLSTPHAKQTLPTLYRLYRRRYEVGEKGGLGSCGAGKFLIRSHCGQSLEVSHHRDIRADSTRREVETRTRMSRWSDRQSCVRTRSGWFGAWKGERNFPLNMRDVGDSTKLAYSCTYGLRNKFTLNLLVIDGLVDSGWFKVPAGHRQQEDSLAKSEPRD
ncbi:hypothetical protein BGY98DRAFT_932404 [Russula aff. rugulosa BPL654]|nr:hypothetical protein BGY98DRAFT_932404 [Russula aff. rugulosa BPL654]